MTCRSLFYLLFFFGLMLSGHPSFAQATDSLRQNGPRSFSPSAIKKTVREDKAFHYDNGPVLKAPGFWDRFWHWVWQTWYRLINNKSTGTIFQYGLWALAVAVVVFTVIKIIGMDKVFFMSKKPEDIELPYTELSNDIHEIPFASRIDEAIGRKHYRLAVRLLYLQTLKQLSDRQLIHWKKEKTNAEYLYELNTSLQKPFGSLTREFEYIWYGEFVIDEPRFFTIKKSFAAFAEGLGGKA